MTQGFRHALDLARDQGRTLRFWLRDDDATRPGPALTRLMALCADYGVPPTLAVIPAHASANLAAALSHSTRVALHGWTHENHAGPGEKKQELGAHRPRELVRGIGHDMIEHRPVAQVDVPVVGAADGDAVGHMALAGKMGAWFWLPRP